MTEHQCQIAKTRLDATVKIPGSKSITNRAIILSALATGTSLLKNILVAQDTQLMFNAIHELRIPITIDKTQHLAEITGCDGFLPSSEAEIDCGNAGTVMRFVTALCALGHGTYKLDGVQRMRQRPIGDLVAGLRAFGCGVEYPEKEDFPPLTMHATGLSGGKISFHSPPSSQLISAMLMVAPYAKRDVMIDVTGDVVSQPYLKMTTSLMDHFGVIVIEQYTKEGAKFVIESTQKYKGRNFTIEPDASNATYFLAAPAIAGGQVTVEGLGTHSLQGDAKFVDVLEKMGCTIERQSNQLTVMGPKSPDRLRGIDIDLNDMPDTVQTLAVVALFAEGPTMIRNIANLRVKETDRLSALNNELTKLGAKIEECDDHLKITPPDSLTPADIDTYDDHRMAMSFALAGLKCKGITILQSQCCEKTFPDFFNHFDAML